MHPVLFRIGSFAISYYGIMNMMGYLLGLSYLIHYRDKIGIDKDTLWNILFITIFGAIVGGKLMYIIVSWGELGPTFGDKMANIAANFRYGFVFFGGFIVSLVSLVIYIKRKKMPLLCTGDFLVVALPLGHAIGRIGCFLAGCCYGRPTAVPWAVHFTNPDTLVPPGLRGVGLHPTQLYESAGNLIIFLILHFAYRRKHKEGGIIALYAFSYGVLRFIVEFFRGDDRGQFVLGFSPSQIVCMVVVALAIGFYFYKGNNKEHAR
ncbi:MAG: prolipoprotein diacylglyceryl transferase [Elusimicrobia bacterium]|nr:prolipoprotein diacylglyceryl transferase [Elusimicrobiota bacterium]